MSRLLTIMFGMTFFFCINSIAQDNASDYIDSSAIRAMFTEKISKLKDIPGAMTQEQISENITKTTVCALRLKNPEPIEYSAELLYKKAVKSVIMVGKVYKCNTCSKLHATIATGFVIGPEGEFVTNYHVVEGFGKTNNLIAFGIMMKDGRVYPIKNILAADKKSDIAILKSDMIGVEPLAFEDKAEVGQDIYCLSNADDHYYAFTKGIISGKYLVRDAFNEKTPKIFIDADYSRGSSGGPILNKKGVKSFVDS